MNYASPEHSSSELSRRSFLKSGVASAGVASVALAAGGSVASAAAAPAPQPSCLPPLHQRVYKGVKGIRGINADNILEKFTEFRELGFDGVESGEPGWADAYHQATLKTGFDFHGLVCGGHWQTRLSDPDQAVRDKGRAQLEEAVRTAYTLRGSAVLLVPGRVTGANETHDDVWNRSIAEVQKVLPLASRLGVRILIETVWNGFCEDPETFRDYVDAYNSPWVGAYYDIGNMQKFAPSHEWIRILGNRIVKLDVKDWGVKNGFCRLGEGDVDWDKVRDELDKIGFTGWATREGNDNDLADTSKLMDQLVLGK